MSLFIYVCFQKIVEPHRTFIKEGAVTELQKDGKKKSRYLFLFNDCIVLCEPRLMNTYAFKFQVCPFQTDRQEKQEGGGDGVDRKETDMKSYIFLQGPIMQTFAMDIPESASMSLFSVVLSPI